MASTIDLEFLQGGLSISLASADSFGLATLCRALGCRFEHEGRVLNVMVNGEQAAEALRHIQASGRVAVSFSHPGNNRTVQFKGTDAQVLAPTAEDFAICRRHTRDFAAELAGYGWTFEFVDTLLHLDESQVQRVRFSAESAFQQTPGPQAGARIEASP